MPDIKHEAVIKGSAERIYDLITTKQGIQKWLRKEDGWEIKGEEELGGTLVFFFGNNHHDMKISKLVRDQEVEWECTIGHPEWVGTTVQFSIEGKGTENVLHFSHSGWEHKSEFFDQCNQVWKGNVNDIKEIVEG